MKQKIFIFGMALACLAGGVLTGCTKKSNASNAHAVGDTLTLNLQDTGYTNWTDTIASTGTASGGYWAYTYNEDSTRIRFGQFVLSREAGFSGSFWAGFTTGSNGDSARYSIPCPTPPCDSTYSLPWVTHQWGVMAGGALNYPVTANPPAVTKGLPYLVSYWNYYSDETLGKPSLRVTLADSALFAPQEIYICNHPWPYWGNIYGDGFARPLNQPGDYFNLVIHAWDSNGDEVGFPVIETLAEYDASAPNSVRQSTNWQKVDLSGWGGGVKMLTFTMETSDSGEYGPNTAVYFNMDRLKVLYGVTGAKKATTQKVKAKPVIKPKAIVVADYFPLKSYTGGVVTVYNGQGKTALKTTVKAGEKLNLSKLPAGKYRLLHGHILIPFTKK